MDEQTERYTDRQTELDRQINKQWMKPDLQKHIKLGNKVFVCILTWPGMYYTNTYCWFLSMKSRDAINLAANSLASRDIPGSSRETLGIYSKKKTIKIHRSDNWTQLLAHWTKNHELWQSFLKLGRQHGRVIRVVVLQSSVIIINLFVLISIS